MNKKFTSFLPVTVGALCLSVAVVEAQVNLPPVDQLQAAVKKRDAMAQYQLGLRYELGLDVPQDSKEAFKLFKEAASAKTPIPEAQLAMGLAYANEDGVTANDKTAATWFLKASEAGNIDATFRLAFCYEKGLGVKQDEAEAAKLYLKCAEANILEAQFIIGRMFFTGVGVGQNYAEAAKWYRKAAERGLPKAQYALGNMHTTGQGVSRDNVEAYKWVSIAAQGGNTDATKRRDNLASLYKMTPDQVADAIKRAEAFKPTN